MGTRSTYPIIAIYNSSITIKIYGHNNNVYKTKILCSYKRNRRNHRIDLSRSQRYHQVETSTLGLN